ncbi:hypothetical protein [Nocardia brasiliensis]|uniref:hypothetical protein n=1 Tax=Nocardia brasiliensis TaxID=37326 RepID=UPI00130D4E66|nr:hypothetical protein [Nocardia brasiliensis]
MSNSDGPEVEPSAATVARDQLLYAIANEVKYVSKDQAGNASAALVELARAYALVTKTSRRVEFLFDVDGTLSANPVALR